MFSKFFRKSLDLPHYYGFDTLEQAVGDKRPNLDPTVFTGEFKIVGEIRFVSRETSEGEIVKHRLGA